MTPTNYLGSDFSGGDGDNNRTMALAELTIIAVDNQLLQPTTDYTFSGGTLTLKNRLWDNQYVTVWV